MAWVSQLRNPTKFRGLVEDLWTRKAAEHIERAGILRGWTVQGAEAETTESIYLNVERPDGKWFHVRISGHPKPGYTSMRNHGSFVYVSSFKRIPVALKFMEK